MHYVLGTTLGNSFFIFEGEENCWAYDLDSQISYRCFAVKAWNVSFFYIFSFREARIYLVFVGDRSIKE